MLRSNVAQVGKTKTEIGVSPRHPAHELVLIPEDEDSTARLVGVKPPRTFRRSCTIDNDRMTQIRLDKPRRSTAGSFIQ